LPIKAGIVHRLQAGRLRTVIWCSKHREDREMMPQTVYGYGGNTRAIRMAIVRGGTSKGLFILRNDLPSDEKERDKIILQLFGSPDLRQIDGLGGRTSSRARWPLSVHRRIKMPRWIISSGR
jgi:hypothetical protein